MRRAEQKSKAPHSRKPAHQAPIQRGSSEVMLSLPGEGRHESVRAQGQVKETLGEGGSVLTGVGEDGVYIEFGADGSEDEATGWPKHQRGEEDACKESHFLFD